MVTKPMEVLDVLRRLQALDDEVHDIRERRDAIVGSLNQLRKVLEQFDRGLADKRDKLAEAESWHRQKGQELETEREKLSKAKAKLSGVTRSKEYVAVNKELENIRKTIVQREDDVAKLLVAIEDFRAVIAKDEEKVRDLRTEAQQQERASKESLGGIEAKIAEVDTRRNLVTAKVDRGIVTRYTKIAAARGGVAVVPVVEGCCNGCHMRMQPHAVEQMMRGSSLTTCPHCSRYLYSESSHGADGHVASV
jgi:predicted  nucleic acid-binding Zn-ribbon protein